MGMRKDAHPRQRGKDAPSVETDVNREAQGTRQGVVSGGLFFEYFVLAKQKKVFRRRGRDPV